MNRRIAISLSTAAAYLAFICMPPLGHALSAPSSASGQADASNPTDMQEASEMVPAYVHLIQTIDAKKVHPGSQFEARLQDKVLLKDGTELPAGTMLLGRVTTDQIQPGGTSRLGLRFITADLKHGQAVPIKVMVLDVTGSVAATGMNTANQVSIWNGHTLRIDQEGVLSGVDMHSNLASSNSALFVSTKKDDVKLGAGSQFSLVIASQNQNRGNSGL